MPEGADHRLALLEPNNNRRGRDTDSGIPVRIATGKRRQRAGLAPLRWPFGNLISPGSQSNASLACGHTKFEWHIQTRVRPAHPRRRRVGNQPQDQRPRLLITGRRTTDQAQHHENSGGNDQKPPRTLRRPHSVDPNALAHHRRPPDFVQRPSIVGFSRPKVHQLRGVKSDLAAPTAK